MADTPDPVYPGPVTVVGTPTRLLRAANVEHAAGLVSCLTDDAHNVYAVLTARSLNPDLFIAARATGDGAEQRLLQAGATRVANPYRLGGTRLAQLVVKPAIVNFFDASVKGTSLQLDQASLRRTSPLVGHTLTEATIRERWGVSVVAIQRTSEVVANPAADFRLEAEDVIVVFGSRPQLAAFFHECE